MDKERPRRHLTVAAPPAALPRCPVHPEATVRRFRAHGPLGPGVYPQCLPGGGSAPHLLAWEGSGTPAPPAREVDFSLLSPAELHVLEDAALGLSISETAGKRRKAVGTVKTQRKLVLAKLGAHNIVEAVALLVRHETDRGQAAA